MRRLSRLHVVAVCAFCIHSQTTGLGEELSANVPSFSTSVGFFEDALSLTPCAFPYAIFSCEAVTEPLSLALFDLVLCLCRR